MRVNASCSAIIVGLGLSFVSLSAFAQEPPPAQPPPAPAPAAAAPAPAPPPAPAPAAETRENGTPDHDKFIGHFAIGYFGIADVPIAAGAAAGPNPGGITFGAVKAPVLGVRYWLQPMIGIDVGIGFATTSGSTETATANASTSTDTPSSTAFAFHAGVPLALASGKHYTWEVIPEATIGFAGGTIKNGAGNPDTSLSGFRLDVGARAGAEIHFGFIGIPELALEGTIGLYFRREAVKAKTDPNSVSLGQTSIGTTVGSDPWALFVNNISALYYF